ncbi:hypothetical protein KFK09_010057 [Dendrobium nobile]|uniref:Uncharacterized protein n=1 Tax=Dendrobium nobile TaxID=94219 RepID=A0A8T3BJ34_DENNO|nr:hypothetical protein KFK09_010057 [Dendrobium nobile]
MAAAGSFAAGQRSGCADSRSFSIIFIQRNLESISIEFVDIDKFTRVTSLFIASLAARKVAPSCHQLPLSHRCLLVAHLWLDCHPTQGISKNSCPVAKCGSLSLGNKSVSACETSICSYAGYTASNILTVLTNQSTCNGTKGLGPAPGSSHGSALRVGVEWMAWTQLMILQIALFLFGFMWNEIS